MSKPLDCLALCLQTPGCLAPFVWGDFGCGKTQQTAALAGALGWELEILRPAERGEGAFGVVPVPSEDRRTLHYPLPDWARRLSECGKDALVFVDEASSIPPALQPPIRGLVLDGVIGGHRLPPHVRRCAAGTPTDQAAGGWDLAQDLGNRFVHLDWPAPSAQEWCDWLTQGGDAGAVPRLDLAAWEAQWPQAKALGAAFVRSHPSALHEDPARTVGRTPPAVATPRSWECALRLLAACRACDRMDLYPALAQGSVGPAVALEGEGAWLVWLRENDLPDPEELLKDPGAFRHDPERPDRTFATLLAVAEAALAASNGGAKKLDARRRGERWNAAFPVLQRALDQKAGKDVVLLPTRLLAQSPKAGGRRPDVAPSDAARAVCRLLVPFIDLMER